MPVRGSSRGASVVRGARATIVLPIRLYRRLVSPLLPQRCKYYPTCSEYAVESIETFGFLRGTVLALWRLLRCNPWSAGGIDHPADQTIFRNSSQPTHP